MTTMDNYLEQGKQALDNGLPERAIALFTSALRLALGNLAEVYVWRGIAHSITQDYALAMNDFNQALIEDPRYADAYAERGKFLQLTGNLNGALTDFNTALSLNTEHLEALYNRALTYAELKHYSHAIADLNQVLALDSGIAQAYEQRGYFYAKVGDLVRAIDDLERYLHMGGGRYYDNHSETQSLILNLRLRKWFRRPFKGMFSRLSQRNKKA
jgi:tetratricopeptide (TPR) repeat protein